MVRYSLFVFLTVLFVSGHVLAQSPDMSLPENETQKTPPELEDSKPDLNNQENNQPKENAAPETGSEDNAIENADNDVPGIEPESQSENKSKEAQIDSDPVKQPPLTETQNTPERERTKDPQRAKKQDGKLSGDIITDAHIDAIREFLLSDIVTHSIKDQNIKNKDMDQSDIYSLDAQWREEREAQDKPLIATTLSNPLSAYLTRIQAHSVGLYIEIFVMDNKGLNVGQSTITTDYWQGDEDKWIKTYSVGKDAIFIDKAEYKDNYGIWVAQVNLSLSDPATNKAIGAATVEINLDELKRRSRNIQ